MADQTKDQGSKERIAKGMDESGKGQTGKSGGSGGKADPGSDQMTKGMAESGTGQKAGTGGKR